MPFSSRGQKNTTCSVNGKACNFRIAANGPRSKVVFTKCTKCNEYRYRATNTQITRIPDFFKKVQADIDELKAEGKL